MAQDGQGQPQSARAASARLVRWYRRHHPLVWIVTALNLTFMLAFVVLIPPFHGPDEASHFDMVHQYQRDPKPRRPDRHVQTVVVAAPIDRRGTPLSIAYGTARPRLRRSDAAPRGSRPTLAEIDPPKPRLDQMTQHPPAYYLAMAEVSRVITLPDSFWSWDRELFAFRVLDVLLVVPLALIASSAALALGLSRGVGAVAAAFTLLIPEKSFLGSVVTNDAGVIALAGLSVALALWYFANGRPHVAWAAAGAAGLLALTKSTGAVVTGWVAVVIAYRAFETWRSGDRSRAWRAVWPAAGFIAIGSTWYVANVLRYHKAQPAAPKGRSTVHVSVPYTTFLWHFLDQMSRTFWGLPARRLGIGLPWWASHTLSFVALLAIPLAFWVAPRLRRPLFALLVLCAVNLAVYLPRARRANRVRVPGQTTWFAIHGRYLYALLVPLAIFFAVAYSGLVVRLFRRGVVWLAVAVIGIGCATHVATGIEMLTEYWQRSGGPLSRHLGAMLAWSPLPTFATLALLVAPFVVMLLGLWYVVGLFRARVAGPGRQPDGAAVLAPAGS